jgi:hypothetical protein
VTTTFTEAELLKFHLLERGIRISPEAATYLASHTGDRALTAADYASTSGIILKLSGDVWVNAPIEEHNPNFVNESEYRLTADSQGLWVEGGGLSSRAWFWLQPAFHGRANQDGVPYNSLGFAHTDRLRISPIEGCAFTCKFCDLPYEFRYRAKDVDSLVDLVNVALADPVQPVAHVLISGGTPRPEHHTYVREVYQAVIGTFPDIPVDIMMVPIGDVMDPVWLEGLGVNELSVNIEVWSSEIARRIMPRKHKQGRDHYLDYLAGAAAVLGGDRVRSMFMLGLEPLESTLEGVAEVSSRGCVPVLSPFRPDPSTPLRQWKVPTAALMQEAYLAAREITQKHGVPLGPSCIPCAHNTLSLPANHRNGDATLSHGDPNVV